MAKKKSKKRKHKITTQQKRFCEEYIKDNNATQAAIRVGYSKKTANNQASRLLTNVYIKGYVKKLQDELALENKIDREYILEEYAQLLNSCKEEGQYGEGRIKDRTNWNKALSQITKMLGLDEPDKQEVVHKGLEIKYVKPSDRNNNDTKKIK